MSSSRPSTTITSEMIDQAWSAIGMTKEGRIVRAQLAELLMAGPSLGQNVGAVYEQVGRLSLARDLVRLLDMGYFASGYSAADISIVRESRHNRDSNGVRRRVPVTE